MVMKFMVSGADLEKPKLRQPETVVEQPPMRKAVKPVREVVQSQRIRPLSSRRVKLCLLLIVVVILGVAVYYLWPAGLISHTVESLPTNKGGGVVVSAIVYSEENASAIVSNRVVHEGDIINGYKVAKIHRDKVEFEKKGKIFTKQVNK